MKRRECLDQLGLGELPVSLSFHINVAWQCCLVRVVLTGEPMIYLCIDLKGEEEDEVDPVPSVCVCVTVCYSCVLSPVATLQFH